MKVSIGKLRKRIKQLPPGRDVSAEGHGWSTHKEHWLRWLKGYHSPGAYGRKITHGRDAEFSYNHVMNPEMLLYLIRQSGVSKRTLSKAINAAASKPNWAEKVAVIRETVPWEHVAEKLWPAGLDPAIPVLSVKQPWAEALMIGKKKKEHRPVKTNKRCRVYIYASKTLADTTGQRPGRYGVPSDSIDNLPRGMIIGSIEIFDCVEAGSHHGARFHWHVRNPRRLRRPVAPPRHSTPTQTFWFLKS